MKLIVFLILLGSSAWAAKSSSLNVAELNTWAQGVTHELLSECSQQTQKKWLIHYSEIENKILDRSKGISAVDWKKIPSESVFRDLFEVVFPQVLPKTYPMRGAFASCFSYFEEYKNVKKETLVETVKSIEECYQDRYQKNPPSIVAQYLSCLRSIKE